MFKNAKFRLVQAEIDGINNWFIYDTHRFEKSGLRAWKALFLKLAEECSEVTQAILHAIVNHNGHQELDEEEKEHIYEEIADVLNTMDILSNNAALNTMKIHAKKKIKRQEKYNLHHK